MAESSEFKGILGMEFLSKHSCSIDFAENLLKYKSDVITLSNEFQGDYQCLN